jgi:hypothetical protein
MACTMTNNPPGAIARAAAGFAFAGSAMAASTVNVPLPAGLPLTMDGVVLAGGSTVLLTGQTVPAANSLYTFRPGGNVLDPGGQTYDAGGVWTTTLPAGVYVWTKGPNATSISDTAGHTRTTSGDIQIAAGVVTFRGAALASVVDGLALYQTARSRDFDASAEFTNGMMVQVSGGTANSGTWQYTGITNPVIGTTALPWAKISAVKSPAISIPGHVFTNTAPGPLAVCSHIAALT